MLYGIMAGAAPAEHSNMLKAKRIIVTGGSRGIGAAIVSRAAAYGAEVAFTYHSNQEAADALAASISEAHPEQRCIAVQCDVADNASMGPAVTQLAKELGGVDALINNAGITRDAAFGRMKREDWDAVLATNLGGVFNATQPLMLPFVKQRRGAIINITSLGGIYGSSGQANYSASKAGMIGVTKSLSKELAPFGVRVNAVAPGFIETDMISVMPPTRLEAFKAEIPMGRLGQPDEVAELVCFLASDRAAYITGQVIEVSGGLTL